MNTVGRNAPEEGTATPSRSPLYALPRVATPLRVRLVVPETIPRWIADFVALVAEEGEWLELDVARAADLLPGTTEFPFDVRACLAIAGAATRREHGMLAPIPSAALGGGDPVPAASLAAQAIHPPPDLVLLLGPQLLAERLAAGATWGCWRIDASLADPDCAGAALLSPVIKGADATEFGLELAAGDTPVLGVASSWGATRRGWFHRHREQAFRKLPALLLRGLRRIADGDLVAPAGACGTLRLVPPATPLQRGDGLRAQAIGLQQSAEWQFQKRLSPPSWMLALRHGAPIDPLAPTVGDHTVLAAPPDRFWADPCLVADGDRTLLFVEELATARPKGVIACIEVDGDRSARRLGIALEEACHLSYPQVFQWEGEWYLTVESSAARRISLYRADAFPLGWRRIADLVTGRVGVDPTLHFHAGHWYLFANIAEGDGSSTWDELFLFVSDSLAGPYRPHPANPIVADVRRARPAGRLFEHGGRLIRPAQDCARKYGAALVFHEVLELSPTRYRERELERLHPWAASLDGCHTYSAANGLEVLDARGTPPNGSARCHHIVPPAVADRCEQTPLASVLLVARGRAAALKASLDGVLAQTLPSFEVIVVDDGTHDGSSELAARYAAAFPRLVRVVRQEDPSVPLARNAAIAHARGRYLALLEAGTVWTPEHLAACIELLEGDPSLGLVHAGERLLDADDRVVATLKGSRIRGVGDAYLAILLRQGLVRSATAVFRRSVVDAVGPFDRQFDLSGGDDRDMWLRIAEVADVACIDAVHAERRVEDLPEQGDWHAQQLLVGKHTTRRRGRAFRRRALAAVDTDRGYALARAGTFASILAFLRALGRDPLRLDAWKGLWRRLGRRASGPALPP